MEARFQLVAANLAAQLAGRGRVGLAIVNGSFCHPGARGQGGTWHLWAQTLGSDSSRPACGGKCGVRLDCVEKNPGRESPAAGGLEDRGVIVPGQQ